MARPGTVLYIPGLRRGHRRVLHTSIAIPAYAVCVYLSVKHRKMVAPLVPDAFVFVCGPATAWCLARRTGSAPRRPRRA